VDHAPFNFHCTLNPNLNPCYLFSLSHAKMIGISKTTTLIWGSCTGPEILSLCVELVVLFLFKKKNFFNGRKAKSSHPTRDLFFNREILQIALVPNKFKQTTDLKSKISIESYCGSHWHVYYHSSPSLFPSLTHFWISFHIFKVLNFEFWN
jgi:hypothetical protein